MNSWAIAAPAAIACAAAGITAYGAAFPRAQLFGRTICRTNRPNKLAITFDDGPNPASTPKLLDLLDRYEAKATFFLIGRFVRERPDLVKEIVARGHSLGNHTHTHPNLFWLAPARIAEELCVCQETIGEVVGAGPSWFRPPFGMRNPWVIPAAAALGCQTVMWTLIPGDWLEKPAEWLIERMNPIAAHARKKLLSGAGDAGRLLGDILCLHDGGHRGLNADRTRTLAALQHWLPRWRDLGLDFVTMDVAVQAPAS
ncbi:MAG TPA: polysaccharide deacetylase family protein [Methylomirabilota bacterium]|nr:polysaccharide deacetylase family protein [Methylomirabilota bacterium]